MNDMTKLISANNFFRGQVFENIVGVIEKIPLIRLKKLACEEDVETTIIGKCELSNPLGSIKGRIGLAIKEALGKDGLA
jgi:cysteine synthase A